MVLLDVAEVFGDGSGAALGEVSAAGGEQDDVPQQGEHEHQGTLHARTVLVATDPRYPGASEASRVPQGFDEEKQHRPGCCECRGHSCRPSTLDSECDHRDRGSDSQ